MNELPTISELIKQCNDRGHKVYFDFPEYHKEPGMFSFEQAFYFSMAVNIVLIGLMLTV